MTEQIVGRNEPCPCGSGKKYKRCCGVDAAPKLSTPKAAPVTPESIANQAGIDPSTMDMAWMAQMSQAFQRLPRGQMQRLQALMQKAMSGRDISAEAEEFQKTLPLDLQQMLQNSPMGKQAPAAEASAPSLGAQAGMSEEEAKKIVEAAAAEGKLSKEEADQLLQGKSQGGFGKVWGKLTGKK